eukprot:gnl/TRDRNA2_/TRDRNA2_30487_c0_seq1.p1 gnl/TRDRNA2_/TRDRNA2_30487_c0~~gnl/TRDRNA2_/TRDRNA2_30487_c0_seq1.p1  ORF type:complete len:336 (+),score=45.03 gnl/TRDRNA2_/TRDRNA2_30487_c0_seq1:32-1039(+)
MEGYCSDQVAGTCLAVGASFTFASIALVVTIDTLPVLPATESRYIVCWLLALLCMARFKVSRGLYWFGPPEFRRLLLIKAALSFSWVTLWWTALRRAPMGDCIALVYCAPILTSVWSALFLGEKLPQVFLAQTALVSGGMLLIIDPPFLRTNLGAGKEKHGDYTFVLMGLVVNSFVPIVTRQTRACSWIEVEHVVSVCSCLVFNPCLLLGGYLVDGTVPPMPPAAVAEAGLIATAALGTFAGVAMETKGYQLAEPGKAAMFRYIEVPFAYFLQHIGTPASPIASRAISGSVLIIISCALGAWDQRRSQQKALATAEEALLKPDHGDNGRIKASEA